jgi:Flp pilus assembly protein TadG
MPKPAARPPATADRRAFRPRLARLRDHLGGRLDGDPERGAAIIEFVVVFLAIIVPLLYAIAIMADVQRAMMATSSAAREVGRVYATAATQGEAEQRATTAYADMLGNYRYSSTDPRARIRLTTSCPTDAPSNCRAGFGPGAEIEVLVTYDVPVTRIPLLGIVAGPTVTIGSTHHTRADRFRGLTS